jgi:hypothetical protein
MLGNFVFDLAFLVGLAGLTGTTGFVGSIGFAGTTIMSLLILAILAESIWRIKVTIGNVKAAALWIHPAMPKVMKFKNPSLMSTRER